MLKLRIQIGFLFLIALFPPKLYSQTGKNVNNGIIINGINGDYGTVKNYITIVYSNQPPVKSLIYKDSNYKGYSASIYIRIDTVNTDRRQFFVDIGKDSTKNRISLYLDKGANLVYRVIDNEGDPYTIKALFNKEFKLKKWYLLNFDYGYCDSLDLLRKSF